jgi:hypothetical protein
MRRTGLPAIILVVLQADARADVNSELDAYGLTRNGISVQIDDSGYLSAHVGSNDYSTSDAIDAPIIDSLYNGARDLGQEVLYDSRSPQTIVPR